VSPRIRSRKGKKNRLEAFSDGVFAIAITLLVLEIAVPAVDGDEVLRGLFNERQIFLAYFVAFMAIGVVWIEHSALVDALDHVDAVFMRLNLLLLLLVSFLPFPTKLMSEYFHQHDFAGERVGVVYFGAVLLLQSLLLIVMGRYAEREGLFGDDMDEARREDSRLKYQLAPSLALYAGAAFVGFFVPYLGVTLYLLIALYLAVPVDYARQLFKGRREAASGDQGGRHDTR